MSSAHTRAGLLGLLFTVLLPFSEPANLPTLCDVPPVGVRTMAFTDKTRLDDFAPFPKYREVVVSLFYPTEITNGKGKDQTRPTTNYLPNGTARYYDTALMASGAIERMLTYSQTNGPLSTTHKQSPPLLVFSPGYTATFHLYTTILQEVARKGYVVAAIDHPYDADIVEFPDGRTVLATERNANYSYTEFLNTRTRDVSFVLNELSQPVPSHPFALDTRNVIAFGHSLGGDTAVEVMLSDRRIKGGINFDGAFHGKLNSSNCAISRPVLLIRTKDSSSGTDGLNWNDIWNKLVGWKLELTVSNTTHNSFSDLPLVADVLGIRAVFSSVAGFPLGDLDGLRGLDIMSSYVSAFAKFICAGDESGGLKSKVGKWFTEVGFVRKGGPQRDADISSY